MEDFEDFEDFFWRILRISRTSCAERRCILRIVRIFLLQKSPKLSKILQNTPALRARGLHTHGSIEGSVVSEDVLNFSLFLGSFAEFWKVLETFGGEKSF